MQASEQDKHAVDMKKEVSQALTGIQITDSRFTNGGNIVMNFENENAREEAAKKLGRVEKFTTKNVKKLIPKIIICNVHKEETKGSIIKTIFDSNQYLQPIEDVENKIELLFTKPAAGGTIHYVLKCDPLIREAIHKNQDKIKLEWGVYHVRDRYHVIICFYCQRYGHLEANCTAKRNGEEPHCYKCAGNHKSKDCTSNEKNCINCIRYKKSDNGHSANYSCVV